MLMGVWEGRLSPPVSPVPSKKTELASGQRLLWECVYPVLSDCPLQGLVSVLARQGEWAPRDHHLLAVCVTTTTRVAILS